MTSFSFRYWGRSLRERQLLWISLISRTTSPSAWGLRDS